MCGIAGWYRRAHKPVSCETIVAQCDRLRSRGPDDAGYLVDGDFGFGMRRLSIIDITGGHQPISSPDGRHSIIFNGEIYNHLELRREMKGDYPFRTNSDTETILAARLKWGDDAWLRLEGMYSVAIWDSLTKRLVLARDPLGIKPLFYTQQSGGLAFASEITALAQLPEHRFDIDENGVDDFFCFGHVLPPRTIFQQVDHLEPGHTLEIGPTGYPVIRRFWQARLKVEAGVSEADWIERTRTELLRTVNNHLLSDVPVGAFVSGGVDSGAIAAAMSKVTSKPFKIFTAGFPDSKLDETAAARRVAEHLGCEHIVLPIHPQTAGEVLPLVQAAFDEPTAANSAIPLWYLSKSAAEHVKVVLCGEGGDELFMGYKRQRTAQHMARARPILEQFQRGALLDHLPQLPSRKWNHFCQRARKFRDGALLGNGYEKFFSAISISSPELRSRIFEPDFFMRQQHRDSIDQRAKASFPDRDRPHLSALEEFMMGDLTVHMPASLLQRLDRASMAHSLEARVPFLSHRFVDFALTIPTELKLKGNTGKYVLRRAVDPWLPKGAIDQQKMGFQLPLSSWFRGGLNDFARNVWQSSGAADLGLLDKSGIDQLFDEHRSGAADHGRLLYAIAMFSCWMNDQRSGIRLSKPSNVSRPRVLTLASA